MLQALLEDRFRLVLRKEQREMPIYTLSVVRSDGQLGGNLVQISETMSCETAMLRPDPYKPKAGSQTLMSGGCGPMSLIAERAMLPLGRMVVDKTGLPGDWFFRLSYTPDPGRFPPSATLVPNDANAAPFPTALREQLGLKVESGRDSVDVLVVESVQPPAEN